MSLQKQIPHSRKKAVEARLDKAEDKLFDGVISDEDSQRLRARFGTELAQIDEQVGELDRQQELDIDVIQGVIRLPRDIYRAYRKAPYELKRHYLELFWNRFLAQDKKDRRGSAHRSDPGAPEGAKGCNTK